MLVPLAASAQIKIASPTDRSVYQRDVTGLATFSITGTFSQPIDKVEVRAVPVIPGQGISTNWAVLDSSPKGGVFLGTLRLQGGWYTLEVRGTLNNTEVGRDVVPRMGVGEVFVLAGQSNAQGLRDHPGPGAADDRVNYIVYDNTVNSLFDPPAPTFAHLNATANPGPRGQTAWAWGVLGDLLAKKLNVPILFINTAWEGTSSRNWAESANGQTTNNEYGGFPYPAQMPYANLLISTRHYVHQLGVRAILWMQGETDTYPLNTSARAYQENLQFLINKLSSDTGKRINWVIARTSRTQNDNQRTSVTSAAVIEGQNAVLNTPFNSTYPGPETDNAYVPRPDGVHFQTNEGQRILANLWDASLNINFFSTITPVNPALLPALTSACGTNNQSISLTLPAGYSSYNWSSGQSGRTITVTTPGTYRAVLKDANGNALIGPSVSVESSVKPATPTIVPGGQQQACADAGFTFSASGGPDLFTWSNGAVGRAATVMQSGTYTVKAQNVFGCVSDNSAAATLTVRPAISKPVVEPSGPFSLGASITETGLNEKYEWRRGDVRLEPETKIIKVVESGTYAARAKTVFTLGTNNLTCYSAFSDPITYALSEDDAIVMFPNPNRDGLVAIETREDLTNVEVFFYTMRGEVIKTERFGLLNQRQTIDVSTLPNGMYIVRVKASGLDITKRIVID